MKKRRLLRRGVSIVCYPADEAFRPRQWWDRLSGFVPVAEVQSGDLDQVFGLAQHRDLSGQERVMVRWYLETRSMMVGDLVVTPVGHVYRCKEIGWDRM